MIESKYKLVPVEPTEEMLDKLFSAGQDSEITRFRAMLAAAPEVNPWVSVDGWLPSRPDYYLFVDSSGSGIHTCWVDDDNPDYRHDIADYGLTHVWDEYIFTLPRPKV